MRAWDIVCMIIGIFIIIDDSNKPMSVVVGSLMVMVPIYFNYWSK